ncbi:LytTR family DNA-binding domain-containing protein [Chitinophaga caseinilytica]|jgi:two-component system LytT family response regulator|uniref:LytTR family DNA-binding domain-containing protein n=1 Tax=Chitinophaga caseinilytica TaxID=2267521 RepID=A0ABZ2Z2L3_9BACT
MRRFKTIIVEDEPSPRKELEWLVERTPQLEHAGTADSVEAARELIIARQPDLLLLDIQLKDGTAFDLLHHFPNPAFRIIFITAFGHHAIRAIRFGALDYLLKPLCHEEFSQAAERLQEQELAYQQRLELAREMALPGKPADPDDRICIPSVDSLHMIRLGDIVHLAGDGAYTSITLHPGKKITASRPLKHYESLLPPEQFIRPHQSWIVNRSRIAKYLKSGFLVMDDQSEIPVATRKRDLIIQLLSTYR